jgi:integrase
MALNELSQKELEQRIKAARESGKSITKISDGSGLYLVVRGSGGMSWQLDYTLTGIRKTFSMGLYPQVRLSTARTLAEQARALVQVGVDPVAQRREARQNERGAKSVAEVIYEWLEHEKGEWSDRHYDDFLTAAKANVLATHGARRITELTTGEVRDILKRVEDREALYMLTRVRSVLTRACQYAEDKGYLAVNPVSKVKRREYKAHVEGHHPAITDYRTFRDLLLRLDTEPGSIPITALRFAVLVWVRPQNLRSAEWRHFDLGAKVWEVPHHLMKRGREHLVPLSTQAVVLLRNWQTITGGERLVFPGHGKNGQLSENTLNKNLERLGYAGKQTAHGFRASARTILEEGGFNSKYTKKQLAHDIDDKTDRAYNRAEYWSARVPMMQAWADYLDALRQAPHLPWTWFADWHARQSSAELPPPATNWSDRSSPAPETRPFG